MGSTIANVLAALIVGFFVYKNYTMNIALKEARVAISDLETSVAKAKKEVLKVTRDKDKKFAKFEAEVAAAEKERQKKGITTEGLAAKEQEIETQAARIAELEAGIEQAREIMTKQKESLSWYKTEMRKLQHSLTSIGGSR